VLQYAGDNLLAVFGADEAHEDDAECAVRCGLTLLAEGRALGEEVAARHHHQGFNVRVGLHTGGVLLGARALPWSSAALLTAQPGTALVVGRTAPPGADEPGSEAGDVPTSVPYLGVGYSDASTRGGWGFSADFGVLALAPKPAVRLGRVFSGQQSFDDLLRELRLTPSVQVGVSYSF
jgi:hypothetical protein